MVNSGKNKVINKAYPSSVHIIFFFLSCACVHVALWRGVSDALSSTLVWRPQRGSGCPSDLAHGKSGGEHFRHDGAEQEI